MGFAEWQLLQHGVRCLSVGHIQDEDDTRPVFQRIPLVDLAIEIELRGLANLGRQNALNLRHVRARGEGADGQNLGGRRLRHRCLSNGTVGGTSQDRGGSQISERTFDHGRTFLRVVGFSRSVKPPNRRCGGISTSDPWEYMSVSKLDSRTALIVIDPQKGVLSLTSGVHPIEEVVNHPTLWLRPFAGMACRSST